MCVEHASNLNTSPVSSHTDVYISHSTYDIPRPHSSPFSLHSKTSILKLRTQSRPMATVSRLSFSRRGVSSQENVQITVNGAADISISEPRNGATTVSISLPDTANFSISHNGAIATPSDPQLPQRVPEPLQEAEPTPSESHPSQQIRGSTQEAETCCICFEELGRRRPDGSMIESAIVLPGCQQ